MKFHKLSNQPLSLVLTEFRFSPVLAMENYVPEIQEALRDEFPEYRATTEHQLEVARDTARHKKSPKYWQFSNETGSQVVRVTPDTLVFYTTEYDRFPGLRDQAKFILNVLISVVRPKLLKRIGLRYNDTIVPDKEIPIEEYLIPQLFPAAPLHQISNSVHFHRNETQLETDMGTLILRSLIGIHGLPALPDLLNSVGEQTFDEVPTDRPTAVLDFDHIWENSDNGEYFQVENALENLEALHEQSRSAFWKITTDRARKELWV